MLQWLKDHVNVVSFAIGILGMLISFIVYLDTQHDKEIAKQVMSPIMQDIHDEVIQNRTEVIKSRSEIDKLNEKMDEKINELERQTVQTHTKLDVMLDLLKKDIAK